MINEHNEDQHRPTLPALLVQALQRATLTGRELARSLGISPAMLTALRQGKHASPDWTWRVGLELAHRGKSLLEWGITLLERAAQDLPHSDPRRQTVPRKVKLPALPARQDTGTLL